MVFFMDLRKDFARKVNGSTLEFALDPHSEWMRTFALIDKRGG
jgi:hypothetical protein